MVPPATHSVPPVERDTGGRTLLGIASFLVIVQVDSIIQERTTPRKLSASWAWMLLEIGRPQESSAPSPRQ